MAEPAIIVDPTEVEDELRQLDLDRDGLIEVVRYADREAALCTSNDPAGFDLITVNAKAARGLRERYCGACWIKDEELNQPGIRHSDLNIRVIPCNFDEHAGSLVREPTNRVGKGSASRVKTRCNGTGWLPHLPDIPAQQGAPCTSWVLGIFSQQREPLRAELSLPVGFALGQYTRFTKRIVLLSGHEDREDGGARRPRDQEPVEEVDIAVKRK